MTFGEHDYGPTTGRLIVEVAKGTMPGYVRGKRNVIYAGDAGRGLVQVCESGRPGERYLLTGTNITMDDLIAAISRIAERPVPKAIPLPLAKVVSKLQTWRYRYLKGPPPRVDASAIAVMSAGQFLSGAKAEQDRRPRAAAFLDRLGADLHSVSDQQRLQSRVDERRNRGLEGLRCFRLTASRRTALARGR